MAAVAIHSDSDAQESKICHSFHCFSFYLPWSDGTGYHDVMGTDTIFIFWMSSFKPVFFFSLFHFD